uniref:Helicase C-terminal domain-containing protein n=1 Tax=Leersia perrieri TaxID=77586 RepID=A0A0D9WG60_9ORYZ
MLNADRIGIDRGNDKEHRSVAGGDGDRIEEHCENGEASVVNGGDGRDGCNMDKEIIAREDTENRGKTELAVVDSVNEELAPYEHDDDYDDEMLEEKLVGDVIRAYSNGADLDSNGVDWEAEDEMGFDDDNDDEDDDDFRGDANEGDKSVESHDFSKVEAQDLVNHNVDGVRHHEDEEGQEATKDEVESRGEQALSFNQGSLPIEILDSDEEIKVVNDTRNFLRKKPSVQAKLPIVPCVAWRTRSSWGMKEDRFSYNTYFEALSDEPKEDDDDTEVELDDEDEDEDDENGDDSNSASCDEEDQEEEEEREEEEEEAQRRKQKKGIDSSDDEMIDDAGCGIDWEEDGYAEVDFTRPLTFQKSGSEDPVGSEAFTQQQKRSRFTWELERRKKLKLGMVKSHRLRERNLESDSNSSSSSQDRKNGCQGSSDCKSGRKKKDPLSKSGKKSSRMLKRQSLMKLLMDKMCSNDDGKSSPFDQKPRIEFSFKDLHPLVFSFGDDDPVPTNRPEQDAELDKLWADLDFTLESENIGTYYDDEGQESSLQDLALASITPCSRGKHEFIIDDQIGIRCKYCSLVNLEIRFILPLLASNFAEKPAWQNSSCLKSALMCPDLYEQTGTGDGQPQDFHVNGTVWDLIPGVITSMYQHQREAFEFMWTNLVGDIRLNELKHGAKPDVVGGCVICHAPGTGKTRLAIVFIQTYMKVFPDCRPVIIAPRGMLFAWEEEFKKWNVNVPFHIMNTTDYSGKEDREICRLIKKEHRTEKLTRLVKLFSWNKGHGVLGISYGLYMKLTSEKSISTGENKVRSILLENPGLLVLDEGHTPRNERSVIWKTLGKVKTEKRIILSGTPFQNNFLELYNILCLVRPRFGEMFLTKTRVGRRHYVSKKRRDKFSDKYEKGVWASLTSNVTDDNAEKVRSILKPFVHIHSGTILRTLPGLRECVIVLKPLPLQKSIIRKVENIGSGNNFEHEYVISLASTHPSLVTAINMSEEEASVINKPMLERLRSNPYEGVKTRFVMEVVRLCEALKEKVLIFSQFIQPLELIKEHLRKFFKWREGKEILQMDGKILPRYRQNSIEVFNNPDSDARVLLASTRACCEGISLTGASRVVLLDVVWNPAVGRQAISRAFRIGQKKFVYTYNLITYGTGEGDKYDRQAEKDHLSKLVFSTEDEFNNVRNMLSKAEMEHCSKLISKDKVLEEMTSHDQLKGMFLKIHYPPTESNIVFTYNQIASELS